MDFYEIAIRFVTSVYRGSGWRISNGTPSHSAAAGRSRKRAHLDHRLLHERFVHSRDAKANNRIREECRFHWFAHGAALLRDIENMPDFQSNVRQPAEIRITMKRHLLDALLRTDHPNELVRERIIEEAARMPSQQSPFRMITRVRKCLQKGS